MLQALRLTKKVDSNGELKLNIPEYTNKKIELIILPADEESENNNSFEYMKLQEKNGFSQKILASKEEDIWNELL